MVSKTGSSSYCVSVFGVGRDEEAPVKHFSGIAPHAKGGLLYTLGGPLDGCPILVQ
jgi:hypothetical protein